MVSLGDREGLHCAVKSPLVQCLALCFVQFCMRSSFHASDIRVVNVNGLALVLLACKQCHVSFVVKPFKNTSDGNTMRSIGGYLLIRKGGPHIPHDL